MKRLTPTTKEEIQEDLARRVGMPEWPSIRRFSQLDDDAEQRLTELMRRLRESLRQVDPTEADEVDPFGDLEAGRLPKR